MTESNNIGGVRAKIYCCLPTQNWRIGNYQFNKGYLTVVSTEESDDIAHFEAMIQGMPKRIQNQIKSLSDSAHDEAMKSAKFRRERQRALGPEAAGAMLKSEVMGKSADEAVMEAMASEEAMQAQEALNASSATVVPQEAVTKTEPLESSVGGQEVTQAKIAQEGNTPIAASAEAPAPTVTPKPFLLGTKP